MLPGKLPSKLVRRHLFFSKAMTKGHLNQERQGIWSTKLQQPRPKCIQPKKAEDLIILTGEDSKHLRECSNPAPIERKENAFYIKVHEATCKMCTDSTGCFLLPSSKGNQYILIGYDYNANYIFAEPMKNRKKTTQIGAVSEIM